MKKANFPFAQRFVFAIYFAALTYIIGVGFVSIVPQVFPNFFAKRDSSLIANCTQSFQQLYEDLQVFHQAVIQTTTKSPQLARNFFSNWDSRAIELTSPPCDAQELKGLSKLRYRTELSIESYMRLEAGLAARVRSRLELPGHE